MLHPAARRRPYATESSPLEIDRTRNSPNYSTFDRRPCTQSDLLPLWFSNLAFFLRCIHSSFTGNCGILLAVICGSLAWVRIQQHWAPSAQQGESTWNWDRHHYAPPNDSKTHDDKTLLLAQLATVPLWATKTCRPNQAYARQWGADYVQIAGDSAAQALRILHDKQQKEALEPNHSEQGRTFYSFVLLLSPDAVVTNMDIDLRTLMLPGNLVAMTTDSSIMLWNLDHEDFDSALRQWQAVLPKISLDLVQVLPVSHAGFIEPKLIKLQVVDKSNLADVASTLQATADAVCYRYYPRCEVL
jgi:hypothetical protein